MEHHVLRTREERLAFARSMNLFSTPFIRLVFKEDKATEYVLRILTGKPDLRIIRNFTEYRVSQLDSRDAVLDVLAVDDQETRYHIEIQLADDDDHIRRVRFYSSMVDSDLIMKEMRFKDLPDTYIFYISMNDFMKLGEPIAKVRSVIGSMDKKYDDGKYIYYVNAAVNDDSEVARLMEYFKLADPSDFSHGELSHRVHVLKCDPEGEEPMCKITQSFVDEGKIIGVVEYLRNVQQRSNEDIVQEIMRYFQLNDYQARTFVYPREAVNA